MIHLAENAKATAAATTTTTTTTTTTLTLALGQNHGRLYEYRRGVRRPILLLFLKCLKHGNGELRPVQPARAQDVGQAEEALVWDPQLLW